MFKAPTFSFDSDRLLGPYFLPPRLIGAVCSDLLCTVFPEALQDVDLQIEIHLLFIHVGAPHIFFLQFGNS
jgi:hypothetical protein